MGIKNKTGKIDQEVLRCFEEALPGQPNPEVDESLCCCKKRTPNQRLRCFEQWSTRQSTVCQSKGPVCQSLMASTWNRPCDEVGSNEIPWRVVLQRRRFDDMCKWDLP